MITNNHEIDKNPAGTELVITRYLGEVVDVKDPLREGRCRVRVFSIFDELPVEDIPWAVQMKKPTFFGQFSKAGSISIPKKGAIVEVIFNNGNLYSPEYGQVQEIGDDIKEALKKSTDFEYEGAHYILFDGDEHIKIYFTKGRGLTFELKDSYLTIDQNSKIEIYHKDGLSSMEFDGNVINIQSQSNVNVVSNVVTISGQRVDIDGELTNIGANRAKSEYAVMGDTLHEVLTVLASAIDAKMPSTPGASTQYVQSMRNSILSGTVTVAK